MPVAATTLLAKVLGDCSEARSAALLPVRRRNSAPSPAVPVCPSRPNSGGTHKVNPAWRTAPTNLATCGGQCISFITITPGPLATAPGAFHTAVEREVVRSEILQLIDRSWSIFVLTRPLRWAEEVCDLGGENDKFHGDPATLAMIRCWQGGRGQSGRFAHRHLTCTRKHPHPFVGAPALNQTGRNIIAAAFASSSLGQNLLLAP